MKSSIGIAHQRLVVAVPREPSSSEIARHRLVVGRLDHVDEVEGAERGPLRLDLAPSCSTSRLTSRMREGCS
jgi:hypothetical protein